MGINHYCQLLTPDDIFKLRSGKIRSVKLPKNYQFEREMLLRVAELLIIINDAEHLTSQSDAIERAINYGYFPRSIPNKKLKVSLKKIVGLSFGYCFGLFFLFSILYQLNDRHLKDPFLRTLNFSLFTRSYWGAAYVFLKNPR